MRTQLEDAGTYWVVARGAGPSASTASVGVWHTVALYLSGGSPIIASALDVDPLVTVHLGSDTNVVIVEGTVTGRGADAGYYGRTTRSTTGDATSTSTDR